MRRSLIVCSLVATTLLVGCFNRPNPRVTNVVRNPADDEDPSREHSFTYDGQGRVSEVERSEGDETRTWDLTWDGATLVKVVVKTEVAGTIDESTTELSYEGGRLVEATTETDDNSNTLTLKYDGQGRITNFDAKADDSESNGSFEYDGDGQIEALRADSKEGDVTTTTDIEIERADNRVASLTIAREGSDETTFETSFDEETNRLSQITFESEGIVAGEPAIITGIMSYGYDDQGRVEQVEQTAEVGDLEVDVATFEVTYDDGDASSLDMAPNEVFAFGIFFDLKGGSHGTLDNTTTVPRLAFASW